MKYKNILTLLLVLVVVLGGIYAGTQHIEVSKVIETGGILAIGAIVFAETGLLIGFFLPGDTLLFAAGFFASQGKLNLAGAIMAVVVGAILGNIVGYEIGRRNGKKSLRKTIRCFSIKNISILQTRSIKNMAVKQFCWHDLCQLSERLPRSWRARPRCTTKVLWHTMLLGRLSGEQA